MSDTGLKYVTSAANNTGVGTEAWLLPSNIVGNNVNDLIYSQATALFGAGDYFSNYLIGTFTHGLTADDTFVGVIAAIRRSKLSNSVRDEVVKLVKNGTVSGNNKATGTEYPTTPAYSADYGGAADMWGVSMTGADTIGLALSAYLTEDEEWARVNAMRMTIYYTSGSSVVYARTVFMD